MIKIIILLLLDFCLIFSESLASYGSFIKEGKEEVAPNINPSTSIPSMPFKLGFEFQETHNLCPWAKNDYKVQKKPLFEVSLKGKLLWKLVLDGSDIEFVLEPFSCKEKELLEEAVKSVVSSCGELMKLFKNGKPSYKIEDISTVLSYIKPDSKIVDPIGAVLYKSYGDAGFEEWKKWIFVDKNKDFYEQNEELCSADLKNIFINKWESISSKITLQTIVTLAWTKNKDFSKPKPQCLGITFEDWFEKNKHHSVLDLRQCTSIWDIIKDCPLIAVDELEFQPQATIQYPLEYSIPLWCSLFEFEENQGFIPYLRSLPSKDKINEYGIKNYFTKEMGILFLHTINLIQMNSSTEEDSNLLQQTIDRYNHGQVDAKGKTNLVSRRPYCHMFKDTHKKDQSTFYDYHQKHIIEENKMFTQHSQKWFSVPLFFKNTEYGEVFIDPINNRPKDLTDMLSSEFFYEDFLTKNKYELNMLFKEGIITTTIIRNFKPEKVKVLNGSDYSEINEIPTTIFENFYEETIRSVDKPNKRYRFDLERKAIIKEDYEYDALSPPWILDLSDSMGFYKDETKIDKEYGEAIIEARMIKNVGIYFLEKIAPDKESLKLSMFIKKKKGFFLNKISNNSLSEENYLENSTLLMDATALFNFLSTLGDLNFLNECYYKIIQLTENS